MYLVGAGPGDPDFLTVRAARLISEADVVVHDRLVHPGTLELCRRGARLIYAGKEGGGASTAQDEIHAVLIAQAPIGEAGQNEGDKAQAGEYLLTCDSRRQEGHEHAGPKITSGDIGMQRLRYS